MIKFQLVQSRPSALDDWEGFLARGPRRGNSALLGMGCFEKDTLSNSTPRVQPPG